jgi:hypothetical protein
MMIDAKRRLRRTADVGFFWGEKCRSSAFVGLCFFREIVGLLVIHLQIVGDHGCICMVLGDFQDRLMFGIGFDHSLQSDVSITGDDLDVLGVE